MAPMRATLVAEVGGTHIGDMGRAKHLIDMARASGADYVKFQKRNPVECVPEHLQSAPHPNPAFAYGPTYLMHRQALELTVDQHAELRDYCKEVGIGYATSIWDKTSATEMAAVQADYIKIPSACNLRQDLYEIISKLYPSADIHVSLGMLSPGDVWKVVNNVSSYGLLERTVFYHSTSEYPCPPHHLYLSELNRIRADIIDHWGARGLGFSNHSLSTAADIAAYVLGAQWIERHFIDSRFFRHTDSSCSLEPNEFQKLRMDLDSIRWALQRKRNATEEEIRQRDKLSCGADEE
jgi:N-acetylneuraminate synthase